MSEPSGLENGLLSFSNPNYQLEPPDVNSNLDSFEDYEDLYEEFDTVCSTQHRKSTIKSRRNYAKLDPVSMGVGVDLESSPMLAADFDNNLKEGLQSTAFQGKLYHKVDNESPDEVDSNDNKELGQRMGFLDYYINLETALRKNKDKSSAYESTQSGSSTPNCVPLSPSGKNKDMTVESEIGSTVQKNASGVETSVGIDSNDGMERKNYLCKDQQMPSVCNIPKKHSANYSAKSISVKENDLLPSGWEKHEDESGPYYWHISSGTIQREPPQTCSSNCKMPTQLAKNIDMISSISDFSLTSQKLCSTVPCVMSEPVGSKSASSNVRNDFKRRSYPEGSCSITIDKRPVRFAVRSLGWVEIAEDDLTPEKSSKAVNKCIVDLSMGRNDILDVVGRWGDGKDLFMDLDDYSLRLLDTQDLTVLNTQPIHTIRVWGVGRDNGRDFAYVARDRVTRKYMCHVFRCDIPARIIANTLRDICKKIMIERSLQQNLAKQVVPGQNSNSEGSSISSGVPTRPTNFPSEQQRFLRTDSSNSYSAQSFPTPMEEPKKVLKVYYLGTTNVSKATGVDVLHDAIDQLSASVPTSEYKFVNVAVAPSTITISEHGENGRMLEECRVRFLSFLGIGKNVKLCGFIVHTAQDKFVAHVFYCEPSSGALCKTIEAACKLRYQKCLDAHRKIHEKRCPDAVGNKGLATTIRSILGSIGRLTKNAET